MSHAFYILATFFLANLLCEDKYNIHETNNAYRKLIQVNMQVCANLLVLNGYKAQMGFSVYFCLVDCLLIRKLQKDLTKYHVPIQLRLKIMLSFSKLQL